ncbi:MAG: hypothetical protein J6M59_01725 [Bacteroidaceae bacterium]|jgi:hypothetical protein|nr:hypothetical protein [Bacteroidaceae bacterium]MCR4699520.1 hypothetical protein [Bacteroidaceae bacterium]
MKEIKNLGSADFNNSGSKRYIKPSSVAIELLCSGNIADFYISGDIPVEDGLAKERRQEMNDPTKVFY